MSESIIIIIKKIKGSVDAIDRMGDQNKPKEIGGKSALDYNKVLNAIRSERNDLGDFLPPEVTIHEYRDGSFKGDVSFGELHMFYNQMLSLLQ
jgi:hypothetical protein